MEEHLKGEDVNGVLNSVQRSTPARATPVNKEEVRAVVMELGYEQSAIKLGIKAGTLRQWARRFGWNKKRNHAQEIVTTVTKPVQVLADTLQEHERETKLSLARYARKAAQDNERAGIEQAPLMHKVGQLSGLVYKWGEQGKTGNQFTLNVLNINSLAIDQDTTLD